MLINFKSLYTRLRIERTDPLSMIPIKYSWVDWSFVVFITAGTCQSELHWSEQYGRFSGYLLLVKRYSLYKVLAHSPTFFQPSPFCATFFQLPQFMLFIPFKNSPSQRVLGLPIGSLVIGFHLLIFCTILSSAIRSTWPDQFILCFLINPIIFCPNISFISRLVLILQ